MFKDIHDDQLVQAVMLLFAEDLYDGKEITAGTIKENVNEFLKRYLLSYTLKCIDKPLEPRKLASIKDQDIRKIQRELRKYITIEQSLEGILDPRYFPLDPVAKRKILDKTAEKEGWRWDQVYLDVYQPCLNRIRGCSITIHGGLKDKLPKLEKTYIANLIDLGNEIQDVLATDHVPAVGVYQINRPDIRGTQMLMTTGLGANEDKPTIIKATTKKKGKFLKNQRPCGIDILMGLKTPPYAHTIGEHPLARWRNHYTGRIFNALFKNIEKTYKLFTIPNEPLTYNLDEEIGQILAQNKAARVTR